MRVKSKRSRLDIYTYRYVLTHKNGISQKSADAKSDVSSWDQSTRRDCLAYRASFGSRCPDLQRQYLRDQAWLGLAEGAQIFDAAAAVAVAPAAASSVAWI